MIGSNEPSTMKFLIESYQSKIEENQGAMNVFHEEEQSNLVNLLKKNSTISRNVGLKNVTSSFSFVVNF